MTERDARNEIPIDEQDDHLPAPIAQGAAARLAAEPHRRVREGELYYVTDEAAPEGWSVVEIAGGESGALAAFALGQLEAIPLAEIEQQILGPVPRPAHSARPRFAA